MEGAPSFILHPSSFILHPSSFILYTVWMQIVAGKYRHRKLESSPGETTRPITARVKVALFDRLQPELQEARVADIFSGTGTIGLEALSRGAASIVFIESDREAVARL